MDDLSEARRRRFEAYLYRSDFCRGGRVEPQWSADGRAVIRFEDAGVVRIDLKDGARTPLVDMDAVRAAFGRILGRDFPPGAPFAALRETASGALSVEVGGRRWRIDPATAEVTRDLSLPSLPQTWVRGGLIAQTAVPEVGSPDGQWWASVRDGDIVLRGRREGRERRLTQDGTPERSWDIEAVRGRVLPGLEGETTFADPWRPDGLKLFATLRDQSGVFGMPRLWYLDAFESADVIPWQKAGGRLDRHLPFIVDVRSGAAIPIQAPPCEDGYLQLLGWRPDGAEVFFIVYGRDLRRVEIFAADGRTGAARRVLLEEGETFLRLQHDAVLGGAHGFAFVPPDQGFLWLSARDGWTHIWRHGRDGEPLGQLTSGPWPVHDIVHVGGDGFVYFTASPDLDRPYDIHVCRAPLDGGPAQRLTKAPGVHRPRFAPSGGAFVDVHSAYDRPWASDLVRADGQLLARLEAMDIAPLRRVGYAAPEEFVVKAADGETDLWGVLYTPADFDPARRYPVIEHIYGGPQVAAAARQFSVFPEPPRNIAWAMAQLGYVVVALDARGTPGRSKAFQDVVYKAWGRHEIADHAAAVRQLLDRHSWMDGARVGILGHSWGAYFAAQALIEAPDLYTAAVGSSPGFRPWESILYEPYLGLPDEDRAPFDAADLPSQAARVRGALLLMSGTAEYGVVSDAFVMSRALIDAGVQHEFAILPGEHHGYVGAAARWYADRVAAFFERHLQPGASA